MIGSFLSDSSNQRKIAVAICAFLALFSNKVPILANVSPELLMTLIGAVSVWILQSGAKAAVQAHADGKVAVVEAQKVAPQTALAAPPAP